MLGHAKSRIFDSYSQTQRGKVHRIPPGEVLNGCLTLFKTEISDFPTLFETASRFLRTHLNTFSQKSLCSFVVVQASGISANQRGYEFRFLYHFYKFECTHFLFKCKDTLFIKDKKR